MFYLVYAIVRLVCGTLFPAYCSYKAVKNRDAKEYVQWMTYWIVFALITLTEEVADLFLGFWFPLYYELKTLLLVWLLSPSTRGSSFLYRQVIHPTLIKREEDIDDFVKKCKEESYSLGVKYTKAAAQKMTTTVIETALAGGGGLVKTLRHSYSFSDLRDVKYEPEEASGQDEGQGQLGDRVVPRSWHEDSGYQKMEEKELVQMRTVRGRRKESALSSASEGAGYGAGIEERKSGRIRKTSSMYGSLPRTGSQYGTLPRTGSQYGTLTRTESQYGTLKRTGSQCSTLTRPGSQCGTLPRTRSQYGTLPRTGSQYGTLPRTGSQYGTLPRRTKKKRPALPNFSPLGSQSKGYSNGTEEEISGILKRQNSSISAK